LRKIVYVLKLSTQGFISQGVMPENQIPAAQPEAGAAAGEFNFTKPETGTPRIKKRSLKAKSAGLIKSSAIALPAARELEREAPPLSAEQVVKTNLAKTEPSMAKPAVRIAEAPAAPPRTTPTTSATASPTAKIATTVTPTASVATSPHGTRPATLYYTSPTRKAETPSPMKTIPTVSATSSSSASAAATSATRVTPTIAATPRPTPTVDYRANVERQAREQKSVGSILSYVVYGLIAFFVISAGLAAYGADIIFKQLHDQSATVSDLDAHYSKITGDLSAKLAATQDTLTQAQAQISRQQDLIVKEQEAINQLLASSSANESAIKSERSARAQDTASLRARVKELEYRTAVQKY
jgi:hypothetical protein